MTLEARLGALITAPCSVFASDMTLIPFELGCNYRPPSDCVFAVLLKGVRPALIEFYFKDLKVRVPQMYPTFDVWKRWYLPGTVEKDNKEAVLWHSRKGGFVSEVLVDVISIVRECTPCLGWGMPFLSCI